MLSSESPEQKYRGFLNLLGVILVVTNLRKSIDYMLTYTDQVISVMILASLGQNHAV